MDRAGKDTPVAGRRAQVVLSVTDPAGRPLPAQLIAERLGTLAGVHHAYVSAQTEMAWLVYEVGRFDLAEAMGALVALGYLGGAPLPGPNFIRLRGEL